jgi:hypothetical protein
MRLRYRGSKSAQTKSLKDPISTEKLSVVAIFYHLSSGNYKIGL